MPNKETKALNDKGLKIWGSILNSNLEPTVGSSEFEKAKKTVGPESELFDEIRSKKALLREFNDLAAMNAPESVLEPLRQKLGLSSSNTKTAVKSNVEKLTLLELASQTDDPDIKATIMDMIYPEKANDPISRLERVIKAKQQQQPKTPQNDIMMEWLKEEMKYWREKASESGASPMEMFKEMTDAFGNYAEMAGFSKKGKSDLDPSSADGLRNIKKFGEDMGWFESKTDKIEVLKLQNQKDISLKELEIKENQAKRELDMQKEQMEIAKEGAEILGKAIGKIFGKEGNDKTETKTRTKIPVVMNCNNPDCKYAAGKERFEVSKPEDLGPTGKGRIFNCANDRGGCKMTYVWKGFLNGDTSKPVVEEFDEQSHAELVKAQQEKK